MYRTPKSASPSTAATRRAEQADALVDAAKRGEPRAFDALVRRFRPRIYALALHLTGDHCDADDITQDAFMRAHANLDRFQGSSEFFTWLYRITMNRALNLKRDGRKRQGVALEDPRVEAALDVDASGDPRRALELRETYTHLLYALDGLSPILKSTVVLTQLQGLSHREAAVVMGTREGVISWRLHEARKQLKKALEQQERQSRRPARARREPQGLSLELAAALALQERPRPVSSRRPRSRRSACWGTRR